MPYVLVMPTSSTFADASWSFTPTALHLLPVCQVALVIHLVNPCSSLSYPVRPVLVAWTELITPLFAAAESRIYRASIMVLIALQCDWGILGFISTSLKGRAHNRALISV